MARKKWTPKTEVTEDLLKFREKRKWQLALRRYVLEKKASMTYAPYFGLDINGFREWISIQFSEGINWDNFASEWQFDHILPVTYFDFSDENDLRLCWNFINIRVEPLDINKNRSGRIDVLAVKTYFIDLYNKTGLDICSKMIEKIEKIELSGFTASPEIENFILAHKENIDLLTKLSVEEFSKLNQGISVKNILLEREILARFGG